MSKRFIATVSLVSSVHFLLWWACGAFLKATGFQLFTLGSLFGLEPSPHHSSLQEVAFVLQGITSYPFALLPVWNDSPVLDIVLLVGNSVAWGICICIGIPIYVWRQRTQRGKTGA